MKRLILIAAIVASFGSRAMGATGTLTGTVAWFAADDSSSTLYTGQVLQIKNGRVSGTTCKTDPGSTNWTFIRLPDTARGDQMRAVILSALLSGKTITISVDDTHKDTLGVCYARTLLLLP